VIAIDTNVLVYAHRRDAPFHAAAAAAVRGAAEGPAPWGIPWPCVHEFLAVTTHPRIFSVPSTTVEARRQVDAWLASPTLRLLGESGDHWHHLAELLERGKVVGPKVHDARIAAICRSHGVGELWTVDRDFSRFAGMVTRNPLGGERGTSP